MLWYYYWHRLAGCALAWFFWDVSFYGNKLFQSTFIKIISPGASILLTLEWTLLNSFVSLVGLWNLPRTLGSACQGSTRDKGCTVMTTEHRRWRSRCNQSAHAVMCCADRLLLQCLHGRQALDGTRPPAVHGILHGVHPVPVLCCCL